MHSPGPGTFAHWLRRATGVLLAAYLVVYVLALRAQPGGFFLGDTGRAGGRAARALELALIAALSAHAAEGAAWWATQRFGLARRRGRLLALALLVAAAITALHAPSLLF